MENPAPSRRQIRLVQTHFARLHPDQPQLRPDEIHHDRNRPSAPRASFIGASPARGASIVCDECPAGTHVYLGDPPAADARRIRYLLRTSPVLQARKRGGGFVKKLADYVVAFDRGLVSAREEEAAARDLRAQPPRIPQQTAALREHAVRAAVRRRERAGATTAGALAELAHLAETNAVEFLCELAAEVPALAPRVQRRRRHRLRFARQRSSGFRPRNQSFRRGPFVVTSPAVHPPPIPSE